MEFATIHPFPARMAPELAQDALELVPSGGRVLDPMCGSGTVLRAAVEKGLDCIGVDIDPLAVMMATAWTTASETRRIESDAVDVVTAAKSLKSRSIQRTGDDETKHFIAYWFAPRQRSDLARLATVLGTLEGRTCGALMIAFSRIIVSKEMMASLARDTSHSRPHRVARENDFDVFAGFLRSAKMVSRRLRPERIIGRADVRVGDARTLGRLTDKQFDLVLTSPPYLNAIDYLRGHRLALVWMGHAMASLRATRASSVGAERILSAVEKAVDIEPYLERSTGSSIERRHLGWIRRYAMDMETVLAQIHAAVKRTGHVVLVLGNSFIRGTKVNNAALVEALALKVGFKVAERQIREIPARRRYLPPPGKGSGALDARMRVETVLTLRPV